MRPVVWLLAVALPCLGAPLLVASGCGDKKCTPALNQQLAIDLGTLSPSTTTPLCSTCGGVGETPYEECLSTCGSADGGADANVDEDAEAGTVTGTASTCFVDSCLQAVQAAQGSCSTICSTLYPTTTVTGCDMEGGTTVTCSIYVPESCQ